MVGLWEEHPIAIAVMQEMMMMGSDGDNGGRWEKGGSKEMRDMCKIIC